MNREEFLYLSPYVFSLIVLIGILLYTLRHLYIRGATTFAWLIFGQTLTLLAYVFELMSPDLETKILWDMFQWLTTTFLVMLPLLLFTIQFSDHKLRYPSFAWGLFLTFLGIFAGLLLTDNMHHAFYQNPHLGTEYPFQELKYDYTFGSYLSLLLLVYGPSFYGIGLLMRRAFQPYNLFHTQYLVISIGFLIPLILSFLPLANIQPASQRYLTPLGLAISDLLITWGIFRGGLLDIKPIAHKQIVENSSDAIIVLDRNHRIVDINEAALRLIEKQRSGAIGRTPKLAFANWPFLIELVNNPFEQRKEISFTSGSKLRFAHVEVSHILDRRQELIGRVIVMSDKTKLKTFEQDYQALSKELENRLQKHTAELHEMVERYRTIIENDTDFIVRWKPDGTRTFVNPAYCRYWGITYEQALAMNFLFHPTQEDRPDIEEKIYRLNMGLTDVETEVNQVIKPDGTIGWQEWTDRAIRDEWGKLIEIQSVGRDITERKLAEEKLT